MDRLPAPGGPYLAIVPGGGEYRQVQSSHAGGILKKTLCMQSGSACRQGGQKIEVEGPYPPPPGSAGGGSAYPSAERLTDCPSSSGRWDFRSSAGGRAHKCPLHRRRQLPKETTGSIGRNLSTTHRRPSYSRPKGNCSDLE